MNRTTLTAYVHATRAALRARRIIARIEANRERCTVAEWQAEEENYEPMADTVRTPFKVEA